MSVNMFLKIDGINGESYAKGHKGEIDVLSFSWGVGAPQSANGGGNGGGTGRATLQDLVIVKHMDTTSPPLAQACISGQHVQFVALTIEPGDPLLSGDPTLVPRGEMAFLKLEDVVVASVLQKGSEMGGDFPTEEVALNAGRVTTFTVEPWDGGGKG